MALDGDRKMKMRTPSIIMYLVSVSNPVAAEEEFVRFSDADLNVTIEKEWSISNPIE